MTSTQHERYSELARNFALTSEVDALTAEVAGAFDSAGIETLVLKGPALARWLYKDEVRPYVDSDLLVAPNDRARAVDVLEGLGFKQRAPWMPIPLSLDPGGTAFIRGWGTVDLHCQLPGLEGRPAAVWSTISARADRLLIGGVELRVPDRDTLLLHVALHAAHHADLVGGTPLEDLRRALLCVEESKWSCALEFAREYEGVHAFAAGLRLLPEGATLASRLGLGGVRSPQHEIRREDNVIAEELYVLLSADVSVRRKVATAASDIFPRPDYMRWWSPLARRGKLGLLTAYLWRAIWIFIQIPQAIRTMWRVRSSQSSGIVTRPPKATREH